MDQLPSASVRDRRQAIRRSTADGRGYEGIRRSRLDSTRTNISKLVPKTGKQFQFKYEYDFGYGWEHEIRLEGIFPKEPGRNYPLCLEGERACPPEDVGGIHGFHNFLAAHANPKHENHIDMVRWLAKFDPDKFNAKLATGAMKKGLSDWR